MMNRARLAARQAAMKSRVDRVQALEIRLFVMGRARLAKRQAEMKARPKCSQKKPRGKLECWARLGAYLWRSQQRMSKERAVTRAMGGSVAALYRELRQWANT